MCRPDVASVVVLVGLSMLATGCAPRLERFSYTELIMGVEATVTLYAPDETAARRGARAAFDRINALDAVLSDYRPDSEAMRLCESHDEAVLVSADLLSALTRSRSISDATDGAFDCTIGPVVGLWRESRKTGRLPNPDALTDARARVGWCLIELDPATSSATLTRPGMRLDFGGIGKGLAAQEAIKALRGRGIARALVDLGGDIVASAPPPGEPAWRVRIDTGTPAAGALDIPLVNAAIATSGHRVQSVEIDGVTYSHIVDPRTGLGLTNQTAVTVIFPDGATADALASALSVVGPEGVAALLERFPNAAAMIEIDRGAFPVRVFYGEFPEGK